LVGLFTCENLILSQVASLHTLLNLIKKVEKQMEYRNSDSTIFEVPRQPQPIQGSPNFDRRKTEIDPIERKNQSKIQVFPHNANQVMNCMMLEKIEKNWCE
jgi:hypothetical protein